VSICAITGPCKTVILSPFVQDLAQGRYSTYIPLVVGFRLPRTDPDFAERPVCSGCRL